LVSPSLEVGGRLDLGNDMVTRPYARLGAIYNSVDIQALARLSPEQGSEQGSGRLRSQALPA
jgi:hypothetical protein